MQDAQVKKSLNRMSGLIWIKAVLNFDVIPERGYKTLYLIETPFDTFAKRADPDQAALVYSAYVNMIQH